jgi:hypothetical protein
LGELAKSSLYKHPNLSSNSLFALQERSIIFHLIKKLPSFAIGFHFNPSEENVTAFIHEKTFFPFSEMILYILFP